MNAMAVFQKSFRISTKGRCDVLDVTPHVARILTASQIRELLKKNGVSDDKLNQISDADLVKLYQQTLDQLNAQKQ